MDKVAFGRNNATKTMPPKGNALIVSSHYTLVKLLINSSLSPQLNLTRKGAEIKEFEKALDARSKQIARQLNELDKSTGKKMMEEDKKSNRIGEGANSMRLRGSGGGGEEHSGRIGTRLDTHTRSDTVNREHHGSSNSARIAGGGKGGGKNKHGSDKHISGKLVHGKGTHGNDEKDDSIRLKRPLDSDTLISNSEIRHSGKIHGEHK
jgi:hypothetical protein